MNLKSADVLNGACPFLAQNDRCIISRWVVSGLQTFQEGNFLQVLNSRNQKKDETNAKELLKEALGATIKGDIKDPATGNFFYTLISFVKLF